MIKAPDGTYAIFTLGDGWAQKGTPLPTFLVPAHSYHALNYTGFQANLKIAPTWTPSSWMKLLRPLRTSALRKLIRDPWGNTAIALLLPTLQTATQTLGDLKYVSLRVIHVLL